MLAQTRDPTTSTCAHLEEARDSKIVSTCEERKKTPHLPNRLPAFSTFSQSGAAVTACIIRQESAPYTIQLEEQIRRYTEREPSHGLAASRMSSRFFLYDGHECRIFALDTTPALDSATQAPSMNAPRLHGLNPKEGRWKPSSGCHSSHGGGGGTLNAEGGTICWRASTA